MSEQQRKTISETAHGFKAVGVPTYMELVDALQKVGAIARHYLDRKYEDERHAANRKVLDVVASMLATIPPVTTEEASLESPRNAEIQNPSPWVEPADCGDGEWWFALSCGHVVPGCKFGSEYWWGDEGGDDSHGCQECCVNAEAVAAAPMTRPDHPMSGKRSQRANLVP